MNSIPIPSKTVHRTFPISGLILAVSLSWGSMSIGAAEPPKVGDKAPGFTLKTLDNRPVGLKELTQSGAGILVVLRGWPGYQCPVCDLQVRAFLQSSAELAEAKAQVVFVYPGPAKDLEAHGKEFLESKESKWPDHFQFVLDPDYSLVNAYGLRWNSPNETAYPSTFVVDGSKTIQFVNISHSHGGRTKPEEILAAVAKVVRK